MNMLDIVAVAGVLLYGAVQVLRTPERSLKTPFDACFRPLLLLCIALHFYESGLGDARRILSDADLRSAQFATVRTAITDDLHTTFTVRVAIMVILLIVGALYCYASLYPKDENGEPVM